MSSERTASGQRFFGSSEAFRYCDDRCRPSWEPTQDYRLTAEHRDQLCVHLAAHAVVSRLGGSFVYMLAVAGVGVRSWTIGDRKSKSGDSKWAQCSTSDFYSHHIDWDEDRQVYVADRVGWELSLEQEYEFLITSRDPRLNMLGTVSKRTVSLDEFVSNRRREVRAHVCGYLAGHIADGITAGMSAAEALSLYDRRDTQPVGKSDLVVAQGLANLLPSGEYKGAVRTTEEALRRPKIWESVVGVARQLRQLGLIEGDECEVNLLDWLPKPRRKWPPPRSNTDPITSA